MTQVYTYEIVGQLFGTNLIQSGSIEDANQHAIPSPFISYTANGLQLNAGTSV